MNTAYKNTDEYILDAAEPQKSMLITIREIIKDAVPDATEMISYGMPAFKYKNQPLAYYGAFAHHVSLFPTSRPIEALKPRLSDHETSKGTIKFALHTPLPTDLIKDIIIERITEIEN